MTLPRTVSEQNEKRILSKRAAFSSQTKGRARPERECDIRTAYQRDRDRIVHSKAFRRLKHKTQVFLAPESDHFRTRLTHTLEVSQIARTMARALCLNEDLTEAIALGHDLGHTPFGHAGERALDALTSGGFTHFEQSVRVCEKLERGGQGLNLTYEVLDGILHHTRGEQAHTLEGRLVRAADRIAYINHDIDDAIAAGVLSAEELPDEVVAALGHTKSERIDTLVKALIQNSTEDIGLDSKTEHEFGKLHDFLLERVYRNPATRLEESKVQGIMEGLFRYFIKNPGKMSAEYINIYQNEGPERAVTDYIAGMTDHYATMIYSDIYIPKAWKI